MASTNGGGPANLARGRRGGLSPRRAARGVERGADLAGQVGGAVLRGRVAAAAPLGGVVQLGQLADLRCRGLAAWEFKSFVQEHPEVAWPLLETLASRLRDAEERSI